MKEKQNSTSAITCAGQTILVCEDQVSVRHVMCQALRAAGYPVIEAEDGRQALEVASACGETIDLLISDIIMPGMTGKEVADRLTQEHAHMRVLFISGYAADYIDDHVVTGVTAKLLQKPFGPAALLARVREILDGEKTPR